VVIYTCAENQNRYPITFVSSLHYFCGLQESAIREGKNMSLMNAKYLGELRAESQHLDSGSKILTDAPKDNQGKGEAFSPTDLLCVSLATCKLTTMGIKARAMNIDMSGVSTSIQKIMTPAPRKIGVIVLNFNWNGLDKKVSAEEMQSLKNAALGCPVAKSLDPSVKQTINW
jgi:putative redox protein